jgi:hypothetical protein
MFRIALVAALATTLMGVLHLPFARPVLALFQGTKVDGCPMGWTRAETLTPAQVESRRAAMLIPTRGATKAQARPAFGFELESTTRAQIEAWAKTNNLVCHADRHGAGLECTGVSATALPSPGLLAGLLRVMPGFDAQGRLISLQVTGSFPDAQAAAGATSQLIAEINRLAGPSASQKGELTADFLSRNALAQSRAEWRFHNYDAKVTVTNMSSKYLLDAVMQTVPDAG